MTTAPPDRCDARERAAIVEQAFALGVPRDYGRSRALRLVREPSELASIGRDIHDHTGALTAWLRGKNASAVVVRPDGFIYAATDSSLSLPAPPAGLSITAPAQRNGVPA